MLGVTMTNLVARVDLVPGLVQPWHWTLLNGGG